MEAKIISDEITKCAKCAKNIEKEWTYCPRCGLLLTTTGETAKCASCERLFAVKKSWQKYCSTKCRNDDYWKAHKIVKVDGPDEVNRLATMKDIKFGQAKSEDLYKCAMPGQSKATIGQPKINARGEVITTKPQGLEHSK